MHGWRHQRSWPQDENPLVLNKEDQKKLDILRLEASAVQQKHVLFLREVAKREGIISDNLDDLKSKSGEPFVEEDQKSPWSFSYRRAVVTVAAPSMPSLLRPPPPIAVEVAYFCQPMHGPISLPSDPEGNPNGCGWVKGNPVEKPYDDIGPLSGSAGTDYFCKICNNHIGRERLIMS